MNKYSVGNHMGNPAVFKCTGETVFKELYIVCKCKENAEAIAEILNNDDKGEKTNFYSMEKYLPKVTIKNVDGMDILVGGLDTMGILYGED